MFGPRRTGKTQFLTHDLEPFAKRHGHVVVCSNLWQTLDSPLAILLHDFNEALKEDSVLHRAKSIFTRLAPKFSVTMPDGSTKMEIDLSKMRNAEPE